MIFKSKKKKEVKKKEKRITNESFGELAIDAYETEDELVIQSPIAGITPKDIEISMEDDMLIIQGKRAKQETIEDKKKNYFYQECFWGSFMKKLILPEEVDISKTKANMKDGILTLRIPKKKGKGKKEIKIEVGEE